MKTKVRVSFFAQQDVELEVERAAGDDPAVLTQDERLEAMYRVDATCISPNWRLYHVKALEEEDE